MNLGNGMISSSSKEGKMSLLKSAVPMHRTDRWVTQGSTKGIVFEWCQSAYGCSCMSESCGMPNQGDA